MRGQATLGKSASPNFREVGCANFPLCFAYQTNDKRVSIEAVARRASFAEGSRGREAPLWESRGRSPLGKVRRQQQKPSRSQHSPKQTQHPKMRGCRKNGERSKAVILIKCADPTSPAFFIARPPDVSNPRKERSDFAALSSPNPTKATALAKPTHSA